MVTNNQIKKIREKKFNTFWEQFVNKMNSGKKPLILRLFGSKFPRSNLEKEISNYSFREGFYEGAMYMAEVTDPEIVRKHKSRGIKKQ